LKKILFLVIATALLAVSCVGGYSFTGVSVSSDTKTFSVEPFQNRASIVQPMLSSELTNALVGKVASSTNLVQVNEGADVSFVGTITGYSVSPSAIGANDKAAKNRLTITVRVAFKNNQNPKANYQTQFSRYREYDSSYSLSDVEESLIKEINEELIEDIFNKSFVNW
jgi:hypothetical protein